MNNKGIALEFLVTILLAIIIFIPACLTISNYFRLSDQAKDSYSGLLNDIQTVQQDQSASVLNLFILDANTAAVYFEPAKDAQLYIQGLGDIDNPTAAATGNYLVTVKRPAECLDNQQCLCLLRNPTITQRYVDDFREVCLPDKCRQIRIYREATVTESQAGCTSVPQLKIESCTIGTAHQVVAYHCLSGFILEREVFERAGFINYFHGPRRLALSIRQQEKVITISSPQ